MTRLAYISSSPRGGASASGQAADVFLNALSSEVEVLHIDLAERALPDVTAAVSNAKQKAFMGAELTDQEAAEWSAVVELVNEFKSADHYLMAVPMWNFTVPYRFKQYIDLITQPGLTFGRDENGPHGLASGSVTYIFSRGGDYSPKDGQPDPFDFQSPYLHAWSRMIGLSPVNEVLVQRTMAGPDGIADAVAGATAQLEELAAQISSKAP